MTGPDDPARPDDDAHRIGPYRLLERIGTGAMGEVWRAEQHEPVRRIVALKIIKKGMDTREVITRFEIERQAMALMDHPAIARVYDAGAAADGRPFIAMEYLAGEPITDYCESRRLSIEERLRLFRTVCQAIQHAHQKTVLHRDLKPSNILVVEVDGQAVPKIIDFGIAKATARPLTDRSAATFVGQLIGTPLYTSPEQVAMTAAGVDTRADVYSLGVILYELLVGALPYDPEELARAGMDGMLRVLRESEVPRPSTRVSTLGHRTAEVAALRRLDPRKLTGKLRGDLDWITLKSLEKDPQRRYDTPGDLAEDIGRHLRTEPVEARPPSVRYRTARFAQRHRTAVGASTLLLVLIVVFAAWQTHQTRVIARERDRAVANERLSLARENVNDDPSLAVAYAISSLEVVDQPATRDVVRRALVTGPLRDEWPRHGQSGNPLSVDASLDGRLCAVAWSRTQNPTVGIYDTADLSMRTFVSSAEGFAFQLRFDPNATHVAAVSTAGLHVWRVAGGDSVLYRPKPASVQSLYVYPSDEPGRFFFVETVPGEAPVWWEVGAIGGSTRRLGRSAGRHDLQVSDHRPTIDPTGRWILDYADGTVLLQSVDDLDGGGARPVGRHAHPITCVFLDDTASSAGSVDIRGVVRRWDLTTSPPRRVAEHRLEPEDHAGRFDPHRDRYLVSWGSATIEVFEDDYRPPRTPTRLLDRTHWAHDGTFLPDGTIVTSRNGIAGGGAVAHWRTEGPVAWTLAVRDSLGAGATVVPAPDGSALYVWTLAGTFLEMPLDRSAKETVRLVGRGIPLNRGMAHAFLVSDDGRVAVTYNVKVDAFRRIDLERDELTRLESVGQYEPPLAIDATGRRMVCITVPPAGASRTLRVVDLEQDRVVATLEPDVGAIREARFDGRHLLVLSSDHVVRLDLDDPALPPDTLLTENDTFVHGFTDDGRHVALVDDEWTLWEVQLRTGTRRRVTRLSRPRPSGVVRSDELGLVAAAGRDGVLNIAEIDGDREWTIRVSGEGRSFVLGLHFDPRGRWLLADTSAGWLAWRLPLDPLFRDLPRDEFLARTRDLTNLRVTPDPDEAAAYRIVLDGDG